MQAGYFDFGSVYRHIRGCSITGAEGGSHLFGCNFFQVSEPTNFGLYYLLEGLIKCTYFKVCVCVTVAGGITIRRAGGAV